MATIKHKEIIMLSLVVLGFMFYWFQIRPTQIKKECSWVTEIVPADDGITKEEAEAYKIEYENSKYGRLFTLEELDKVERGPRPETKDVYEATEEEYNACLRSKGL